MRFSKIYESIACSLVRQGYEFIKPTFYWRGLREREAYLRQAWETYTQLPKDTFSPGNRFRAYARMEWNPEQQKAVKSESSDYVQSTAYNYQDGGKVRQFEPISNAFFDNPITQKLIENDIQIARKYPFVQFDKSLQIGLHQIRYKAVKGEASYSSPAWLHKDDEPLVFVHLLNKSQGLLGGDNLLAKKGVITQVLRLKGPLETLVLGKDTIHAVTPMGGKYEDKPDTRDILLVTFQNHLPKPELAATETNQESQTIKEVPSELLGKSTATLSGTSASKSTMTFFNTQKPAANSAPADEVASPLMVVSNRM